MEYLSVTEVTTLARNVLEEYDVWIKGEVSNASADKYYYKYFSLKDENACIACVIPTSKLQQLDFRIEDGITLIVFGKLSIYERDGKFQCKVEIVKKDGEGDLQAKIEAIKTQLQKEGLLDESRKKKLPLLPNRIAVITSKDGAAWKDFLKIITQRYPNLEILLYDVLVQGEKAAKEVTQALKYINSLEAIDLIVITRGGGSLEDLMAFNDESLARAIAASKYPVVSAIGHEKDIAISDLVADLRASTPSNAAELISPHKDSIYQGLDMILSKMLKWLENKLAVSRMSLAYTTERSSITDPSILMKKYHYQLDTLTLKLKVKQNLYQVYQQEIAEFNNILQQKSVKLLIPYVQALDRKYAYLKERSDRFIHDNKHTLENLGIKLELHSPLQILKKGYSIMTDEKGTIISGINQVEKGQVIVTKLTDGTIHSNISDISS